MENIMNMNDNNGEQNREGEYQHILDALRMHPDLEKCTEAELHELASSIKEMALLLYQLKEMEDSSGE